MAPSRFPRLNFSFKPFWSSLLTPPPPMADPLSSGTLSALLNISNGHAFPVEDLHAQYAHTAARTSTVTIDPADITPGVEPDPVEPFPSIRIDAIELRKRSGIFPEHEYLIVYISKDNDSAYAIAKIERTIDSSNPPNLRANVKRTSNIASTSTTSLHDLSRSLSNHSVAAKDYLTINPNTEQHLKTFTQGDVAVYSYTYPPRDRPSITRLVAAALVVHNSQPDYILLSSQCYWYAGVLFRLLVGPNAERLHSAQPVQAAVPSGSLTLPVQSAVPPSSDPRSDPQPPQGNVEVKAGSLFVNWFIIVTNKTMDECCSGLSAQFEQEVQSLKQQITAKLAVDAVKEAKLRAANAMAERANMMAERANTMAEREKARAERAEATAAADREARERAEATAAADREARERAQAERERALAERERAQAERETADTRIAALEAELARLKGTASPTM